MSGGHFIITGTSRGIGEQLARMLLKKGHIVYGIARGRSESLGSFPNYKHHAYDLNDTLGLERLMDKVFEEMDLDHADMICLINNASMLEPLKRIENCDTKEIHSNLQISLVAPMLLTSCFIQKTEGLSVRKKIINISSGSGVYPAPTMSAYCTAKAGIQMFTQSVGAEQKTQQSPVEIIAVNPGMVDTEMQRVAREKNEQEFQMAQAFAHAFESGQLVSTEDIGAQLLHIIDKDFEPGSIVNANEF
ncbi:SDR family NAD(P)-dependent oxidoreductase [Paenibacillus lautus]|jgi:benzil reductase ((S)-benzoin forming)|uniref:SDR family NAD(P)-dependent oxidoreductase n=1 Tax=Paenibacillus lautus TaxID=1401 RepID=UPI0026ECA151|nr:SDR family NAD(P)-dependent oxidoreductase [Paenibacillus lautus]MCI1774129.1 SDR family NAD(P)-dependent oxidoreductase [Paenibacillus lautus]